MTYFNNRLAIVTTSENVENMVQLASVVGESVSFPVALSPTGTGSATHYGMSTVASDNMLGLLTGTIPYPEGVDSVVADSILSQMSLSKLEAPEPIEEVVDGEIFYTQVKKPTPSEHFNSFIEELGLTRVQTDEEL